MKKIRRNFIVIAMLSMFLVLTIIITALNYINYQKMGKNLDDVTHILEMGNGSFYESPDPSDEDHDPSGHSPNDNSPQAHNKVPEPPKSISEETPYQTRYFTVRYDASGTIYATSVGHISAVDAAQARTYAAKIYNSAPGTGFIDVYRYRTVKSGDRVLCIFIDAEKELSTYRGSLMTSIAISAAGLFSVFLLLCFFSKLILRPVEESYRKQKQFLTDAGHELKTPLTIIDANTEVLEMEIGSSKWLDSTRNQVMRLTNMVKQFTALAKMDEAQGFLQKARFSLSQVLNETVDLFIPVATSTHRTLQVSCAEDLYYVGDEEQFRQLFCLLLDNAIKYSTPDSIIELTLCKHGKHLCFTIFNECEGIAKGTQDILFERFYRSDSSRNSSTGGSGIGLSIAHSIVKNHKGSIHAESTDGKSLQIKVLL
ncbi:MAG TPA: two-component sensor histidine kinase [Lachnospiraceae bacterium]|nr:two-component sensor histidine kinase [Lachnospiraceae bacterium]